LTLKILYTTFIRAPKIIKQRFCEKSTNSLRNKVRIDRTREFCQLYFLSKSYKSN
jgi:hypothetical protein